MSEKPRVTCYRSTCLNNNPEEEVCELDLEEIVIGSSGVCVEARSAEPDVTEETEETKAE